MHYTTAEIVYSLFFIFTYTLEITFIEENLVKNLIVSLVAFYIKHKLLCTGSARVPITQEFKEKKM